MNVQIEKSLELLQMIKTKCFLLFVPWLRLDGYLLTLYLTNVVWLIKCLEFYLFVSFLR